MTSDLYFIINVFNISIDNFMCVLLCAIERVFRLLSLNPEYNDNHNYNHNQSLVYVTGFMKTVLNRHKK